MADSTQEDLLAHYCPPLDSALVLAVLADHVDDPSSARETLDALLTSIPNDAEEDSQTTESTGSEIERALTEWSLDDAASKESFDSASLDDPLLFLVSVFPKRARAELEDSLAEQGGDVEVRRRPSHSARSKAKADAAHRRRHPLARLHQASD